MIRTGAYSVAKVRGSKYGAVKTTIDNVTFASKAEARRYQELRSLEKAGEINRILCQPAFDLLVDAHSVGAQLQRAANRLRLVAGVPEAPLKPVKIGRYVADFSYWTKDDKQIIEDVKGFKTPLYRWKKKHVEAQYGIEIQEIQS